MKDAAQLEIEPIHINLPGDVKIICRITCEFTEALRDITKRNAEMAYKLLTEFCGYKDVKNNVLLTGDDIESLNRFVADSKDKWD